MEFEPLERVTIGEALIIRSDAWNLLYQVSRLRLDTAGWSGASAVVPSASANLVGWPEDSQVRSISHLPEPHDPIYLATGVRGELRDHYYEIGHVKGTDIAIGLRTDEQRRGHVAILGMTGMGKTAVAHRVCARFGKTDVVIALDTTGEYHGRLGFTEWKSDDFRTSGHFVYQPVEDDVQKEAAAFIEKCMQAGETEYRSGVDPTRRVILLEEAHIFLPEYTSVRSTRMMMQARKFGLTFIVVSQRTAVVSKSALSQCENHIILKTLDQTGLEYFGSIVGRQMRDAIPSLERYEAVCVGPGFNAEEPVIVSLSPP